MVRKIIFLPWTRHFLLISFLVFGFNLQALAKPKSTARTLEQKIQDLEQQQQEIQDRQNEMYTNFIEGNSKVNTFLDRKVSIGGFFETSLVSLSGKDMQSQVSAQSQIFGLNFAVELNSKIHFVGQLLSAFSYPLENPNNNPNILPSKRIYGGFNLTTIVAQSYLEYTLSNGFQVQSGLGYVPFGYAYQQRDFFLFERRGGPQLSNTGNTNTVGIAFPLWMGLHILGTFQHQDHRWGYDIYTLSPSLKPGTLGGGTRLWYSPTDPVTLGISGQTAQNPDDTYYVYGADIHYKNGAWALTSEYARNLSSAAALGTPESYYFEPSYTFPGRDWLIYAVADYISNPNQKTSAALIDDGYQKWLFGGGVNWMPLPVAKFRFGILTNDYIGPTATLKGQERDYLSLDFSCSVAF